jgi:transcription initiation factor TFIIIB Brf1 subunit/transcription initiation factor TFIIB
VSCQLNLPSFPYREEAARRIRRENHVLFQSQKFGKNKRATVAALLHQVLRHYDRNRPLKEICKQLSLDSKLVMKQSWALNKTVIDNQTQFIDIPRKTSTDYLFEYGGKITNDTTLLVEAEETLMKIRRTGGNPIALASGALYHACKNRKLKVPKDKIGEAFKISHRTVYTNEARIRNLLERVNIQKIQSAST